MTVAWHGGHLLLDSCVNRLLEALGGAQVCLLQPPFKCRGIPQYVVFAGSVPGSVLHTTVVD